MNPTTASNRFNAAARGLTIKLGLLILVAIAGAGCLERNLDPQTLHFAQGAREIEVTFRGEVSNTTLFGSDVSLLDKVHPKDAEGKPRGDIHDARPTWLHFEYRIDGEIREVLIAKQPLLNHASWDDIARAGAAMGDNAEAIVGGRRVLQNAQVRDRAGNTYRVRLPVCGQATHADLSEWNLLIGAVHRGDMDFKGAHYGWIRSPYGDSDLKVGYKGSLTWCRDEWRGNRVARGYFFVSRFHADDADLRTDRLHWRPILERVRSSTAAQSTPDDGDREAAIRWSPSKRVGFAGKVSNAELFGPHGGIDRQVSIESGRHMSTAAPDWLRFVYRGKTLLVAEKPLKYALSWTAIARAGAALGDDSHVRIGWRLYRQDATAMDLGRTRYRVRLLDCGHSTLDLDSEWNALLGGIHSGDEDFLAFPQGPYGWTNPSFSDADLGVGSTLGGATWCRETLKIGGETHAVNRGYLTISRFHATTTDFEGSAFGWRPVLEAVP